MEIIESDRTNASDNFAAIGISSYSKTSPSLVHFKLKGSSQDFTADVCLASVPAPITNISLLADNNVSGEEIIRYTYIDTLINFKYNLKEPIRVKLIITDCGVIGDIEELELYSFGNNEFEVLRELNEEVIYLFEDLTNIDDENLGNYPKRWKQILKRYIKAI